MFEATDFSDLWVFQPKIYCDERGYFCETYNAQTFQLLHSAYHFVQDNQSYSKKGVIRGLHFQKPPYEQAKLVRVIQGEILDIALDMRKDSPTFLHYFSIVLSERNFRQLLIPAGFAHGFSVLSEAAIVAYKCSTLYHSEAESGVRFDDPHLNIDWRIPAGNAIVSEKDWALPFLSHFM